MSAITIDIQPNIPEFMGRSVGSRVDYLEYVSDMLEEMFGGCVSIQADPRLFRAGKVSL